MRIMAYVPCRLVRQERNTKITMREVRQWSRQVQTLNSPQYLPPTASASHQPQFRPQSRMADRKIERMYHWPAA